MSKNSDDKVFEDKGIKVVVDEMSLELLDRSEVDYVDDRPYDPAVQITLQVLCLRPCYMRSSTRSPKLARRTLFLKPPKVQLVMFFAGK